MFVLALRVLAKTLRAVMLPPAPVPPASSCDSLFILTCIYEPAHPVRNLARPDVFLSGLMMFGVYLDSGRSGYINTFKKLVCAAL